MRILTGVKIMLRPQMLVDNWCENSSSNPTKVPELNAGGGVSFAYS
jgi:hypothetical protein